jgi:hypothetical protein
MPNTKARYALIGLVFVALVISSDFASGTAASADQAVTPLAAIQKGVIYLEELIVKGKLDQGWRSHIASVGISLRNIKGFAEYVVSFKSKSGGIGPVSIFMSMDGQYTGSSLE